jgi:hypothetical protein
MFSRFTFIVAALAVAITQTACTPLAAAEQIIRGSPVEVANRTKVDEQAGITVTLAYTAAAKAAALSIEVGLVKDPATIKRIGVLDQQAYAAVLAVRQAYLAANASGYLAALSQANAALKSFMAAFSSAPTAELKPPVGANAYSSVMAGAIRAHSHFTAQLWS